MAFLNCGGSPQSVCDDTGLEAKPSQLRGNEAACHWAVVCDENVAPMQDRRVLALFRSRCVGRILMPIRLRNVESYCRRTGATEADRDRRTPVTDIAARSH